MAKQVTKGGLFSKLGNRLQKAHEEHKNDETKFGGGGNLPPGIEFGIAQLNEVVFGTVEQGKQNAGEIYFRASGIVVSPKQHTFQLLPTDKPQTVTIEGMRTGIFEMVCDTTKADGSVVSAEEHYANILNELRKLGVDTSSIGFDDLEGVAFALSEEKPYFKFRTIAGKATSQYPTPRTFENWNGITEYTPDETDTGVEDNTTEVSEPPKKAATKPASPSLKGKPAETTSKPTTSLKGAGGAKKPPEPVKEEIPDDEIPFDGLARIAVSGINDEGEATPEAAEAVEKLSNAALAAGVTQEQIDNDFESWTDLAAHLMGKSEESSNDSIDFEKLGEDADNGVDEAIGHLTAMAIQEGLDPNDGETYPDWSTLSVALAELAPGEIPEVDADVPEWSPTVGEVHLYKLIDPKTKKPATKATECEVMSVNEETKTVTLKSLDTAKLIMNVVTKKPLAVAWDDLVQE